MLHTSSEQEVHKEFWLESSWGETTWKKTEECHT